MKKLNVGFVGLGARGSGLLKDIVLEQGESVTAVCDQYKDRAEEAADQVEKAGQPRPAVYECWQDMLKSGKINVIVISTAWEAHVPIALAAMEAGIAVGMEVGGTYSPMQCYELVKTYERTKTPFMLLENCCFGRREMMVQNMVELGVLGEVVHCAGGYHHDLRNEIAGGIKNRHYRLRNYIMRNCENYPTHELGPIAKVLGINRGNRMLTLTSTASKAAGMREYIAQNEAEDAFLNSAHFNQGDVVTTVIRCANGETITLTLDTTLPRFYSRGFTVQGTKGVYEEATDSVFLDTEEDRKHDADWCKCCVGNAEKYTEAYDHPVWKDYLKNGVQGGHDGMDWLEFQHFFDALRKDAPMPIDVYDAASWMVISALSEQSVARGGAVVDIPDFTEGKWMMHIVDEKDMPSIN